MGGFGGESVAFGPCPSKGPCVTDDFRGISLVSVPYKAMCMIVKERLALVVEERKL